MNKKGVLDQVFNWTVFRILFMIIISAFLFLTLTSHFKTGLNSRNVENVIMIKRVIYSPNFLAYKDVDTGRIYPGIVEFNKFSTEYLESNIKNPDKRVAVNMLLTNLETDEEFKAYINEERARVWDDYVNVGGYDRSTLKRYVKIHKDGNFYSGILNIKVITKR